MNTPAIRIVGSSGSGRSSIAAAIHKLLTEHGVTSELINCAVDEKTWRTDIRTLMGRKLLPIIVGPNRESDERPSEMSMLTDLITARKSAQKMHDKCQKLEGKLAEAETRVQNLTKGNGQYAAGFSHGCRATEERRQQIRDDIQKEFDQKLAAYKDATRSEMKTLRHGSCPGTFMVSHTPKDGQPTPHIIMSYHRPSEEEIRETCGYPADGDIRIGPLVVPMVPPRVK